MSLQCRSYRLTPG